MNTDQAIGSLTARQRALWDARIEASPFGALMRHTRQHVQEAEALIDKLHKMGFTKALRHVEMHPPSAACIALLAYAGHAVLVKEQTRAGAIVSNAPKAAIKAWVLREWATHGAKYPTKTAFATEYAKRADRAEGKAIDGAPLPRAVVSVRVIAERWLKGL